VVERDGCPDPGRRRALAIAAARKNRNALGAISHVGMLLLAGGIDSRAQTLPEVIREALAAIISERYSRIADHDQDVSMERKKQAGYFLRTT